jgi:hypothetical protein
VAHDEAGPRLLSAGRILSSFTAETLLLEDLQRLVDMHLNLAKHPPRPGIKDKSQHAIERFLRFVQSPLGFQHWGFGHGSDSSSSSVGYQSPSIRVL